VSGEGAARTEGRKRDSVSKGASMGAGMGGEGTMEEGTKGEAERRWSPGGKSSRRWAVGRKMRATAGWSIDNLDKLTHRRALNLIACSPTTCHTCQDTCQGL